MAKSNNAKQNLFKRIRFLLLILLLIYATSLGLLHQYGGKPTVANVDALCPFGAIESFFSLVAVQVMLKRIATSSFILLIAVLISAIFFRRTFCGHICALGSLQEIFGRTGKKLFKKRFNVPSVIDKPLRYLKYIVLFGILIWQLLVLYQAFKSGSTKEMELVIRPYDPWVAYQHILSSDLFNEFFVGFIILIITIIGSFVYDRIFCKYLCPMGGFLGLINRIGLFRVARNKETCIDCKACDKACPVNIKVQSLEKVNSSECINCNECVNSCPVTDTLYVEGPKKLRVSPIAVTLVTLFIFVGVIGITTAGGQFEWFQKTLIEETKKAGGEFDPALIKGRMTFEEIAVASGIPKEVFIKKYSITEDEFKGSIKDSVEKYGFETEDVREFIKEYMEKNK